MKSKIVDYLEPWVAKASRSWESSFTTPPLVDDPEVIDRWEAAKGRAEKSAEWIVWGSRMVEPAICSSLLGDPQVMDDRMILTRVRAPTTDRDKSPDQSMIARRIVACVNSCEGMIDPPGAITETRALLVDLACGRAEAGDPRVLRCLVRLGGPRKGEPELEVEEVPCQ